MFRVQNWIEEWVLSNPQLYPKTISKNSSPQGWCIGMYWRWLQPESIQTPTKNPFEDQFQVIPSENFYPRSSEVTFTTFLFSDHVTTPKRSLWISWFSELFKTLLWYHSHLYIFEKLHPPHWPKHHPLISALGCLPQPKKTRYRKFLNPIDIQGHLLFSRLEVFGPPSMQCLNHLRGHDWLDIPQRSGFTIPDRLKGLSTIHSLKLT